MTSTATGLVKGVLPFSSYFLWTQKGFTRLPLARGSCHVMAYDSKAAFFTRHIVTAAHVAMPIRFPQCFGNASLAMGLGERHITSKVILPSTARERDRVIAKARAAAAAASFGGDEAKIPPSLLEKIAADPAHRVGRAIGDLNTNYKVDIFPTTTVARQTFKQEGSIDLCPPHVSELFEGLLPDLTPIQPGDELLFVGYAMDEEAASPHDGFLTMRQLQISGTAVAAVEAQAFGTVIVCSTEGDIGANAADSNNGGMLGAVIPASIAGGAVLRKSTGRVVGTIAAKTAIETTEPLFPATDAATTSAVNADGQRVAFSDPCVDLTSFGPQLAEKVGSRGIAFTPINEYHNALRKFE